MKKKIIMSVLTIALATIIGALIPMRTYAVSAASTKEYISEVKIGIGKTEEEASRDLLSGGYTILKKDGSYADLNEDADDNLSSAKKVYLGYKTTTDVKYAVTDLAVMNMRGGYSIRDYEVLMENQLKTQVIPFVNRFIATLNEYRANLKSENPANKARAEYMRSMLNKMKDDDTEGLIGDLLVNETKYEMGDEKYNKLSADEKKKHADILTIIMQANGKATLSMETLLTKASDASADSTWITRLQETTLDTLKAELGDVDITEQDNELDKLYYDDAQKILEKWNVFSDALYNYDETANILINKEEDEYDDKIAAMQEFDENNKNVSQNGAAVVAGEELKDSIVGNTIDLELVSAYERLNEIDYDSDGGYTLLDFFSQESSAFDGDDIRNLYPLVASLSAGQIAGLDFLSIQDLVTIATADATEYTHNELGDVEPASIYEGVNREVFEKGKVALTNEALRAEASKGDVVDDFSLSTTTYVLWGATAIASAGMIAAWAKFSQFKDTIRTLQQTKFSVVVDTTNTISRAEKTQKFAQIYDNFSDGKIDFSTYRAQVAELNKIESTEFAVEQATAKAEEAYKKTAETIQSVTTKSKIAAALGAAFTVAMAALAAYSIYSTIKELVDYYNVDYSPIPKYIVEETDITTYNAKGEKIFTGNNKTSAYYRAVECYRPTDDKNYVALQNYSDLNGDAGKQWLALYQVKFEGKSPILANSLKVVTGSTTLPDGYSTGIHMFGSTAAFDLNNPYYVFNKNADDIYVYFKTDDSAIVPSVAGSNFSVGSVFLYGGIGALIGAAIAVVVLLAVGKKKEEPANA